MSEQQSLNPIFSKGKASVLCMGIAKSRPETMIEHIMIATGLWLSPFFWVV